ncbi:hypothetical protein YDYSY3_59770 [Paenibacillus chitinolyticus]|nr:hypothetical protein YDYSY3_59770 [Paenibacillus chitinolyticus]
MNASIRLLNQSDKYVLLRYIGTQKYPQKRNGCRKSQKDAGHTWSIVHLNNGLHVKSSLIRFSVEAGL